MKRHVGDFVRRCLTCQQVKAEHQKSAVLLQPLGVVEWKWEHIMIDFLAHLPRTSRKHDAVWVIVDRLSRHIFGHVDDLHIRGILQVIHSRDCTVTWSANLYHIIPGS